jgi:biotin operon repressor
MQKRGIKKRRKRLRSTVNISVSKLDKNIYFLGCEGVIFFIKNEDFYSLPAVYYLEFVSGQS